MAVRQDFYTGKWIVLFVHHGEVISRHELATEEEARRWEESKRKELNERFPAGESSSPSSK